TITADGGHSNLRKVLLRLFRKVVFGGIPKRAKKRIQNRRACPAHLHPTPAGAVQHLEPMSFHLQKRLKTRQFFRGLAARRQFQASSGARLNLFQQLLHLPFLRLESKFQIPSSKFQGSSKFQAQKSGIQGGGAWNSKLLWNLELGTCFE